MALIVILAGSILLFWGGIFLLAHGTVSSTAAAEDSRRNLNLVSGGIVAPQTQSRDERIHDNAGSKPFAKTGGLRGGGGNQPPPIQQAKPKSKPITPDGTNPFEGWQPAPPPNDNNGDCNWRACLDPAKAAQCSSFCLEQESSFQPIPSQSQYPGDGSWIPDVEIVRRMFLKGVDANGHAFPPPLPDELCELMGPRGQRKDINKEMIDAVNVTILSASNVVRPTRILCAMYTMADAHHNRIRAIRETWAGRCDGFIAFSTASDPRIPAISLPHEGAEAYGNMWQKVRSIWKFIGEHYADQFDYFFLGGDDLFVIPENLRAYLSTLGSSDDDHFVGRRFKGYGQDNYFNSGGAGYALSRGLLKKYYDVLDDNRCAPHAVTSMEDVNTAACLRKALKVGLTDTRDEKGRERFHPFAPGTHYQYHRGNDKNMKWYEDYNKEWGILEGTDCCAPDSVSFHYIKKAPMVRHIYKILYDVEACPRTPPKKEDDKLAGIHDLV